MKKYICFAFLFLPYFSIQSQTKKDSLLVFIGEKIEVKKFIPEVETEESEEIIWFDQAFKAKYRILETIYGQHSGDTISFEAYDHYGFPSFARHAHVMLFVSKEEDDKWYHEKYQYFPLYKAKNGEWASIYSYDYERPDIQDSDIKPEKIDFEKEISFPIRKLTKEQIAEYYPFPYFEIRKKRAVAIWGNYVEELFELKKQGVLKARGLLFCDEITEETE